MPFCHVIRQRNHSYSVICYLWYWLHVPVLLYEDHRNVYFVSHVCSTVTGVFAAGSKGG
jgi:hypothetical protein